MRYIPIAGTWAGKDDESWHRAGSRTDRFLQKAGLVRLADELPFWSSALSGARFCGGSHLAWQFGADLLVRFLETVPKDDRNLIAHSHGGQVVAYALAQGAKVRRVVTVCSPVRRDMDAVWSVNTAAPHLHLYSIGWGDRMRWFGQRARFRRKMPWADDNRRIDGGHSGMLVRPEDYEDQWLDVLHWLCDGAYYNEHDPRRRDLRD
jgi:pimeloyl-ACP methyl ester carboxylesterase